MRGRAFAKATSSGADGSGREARLEIPALSRADVPALVRGDGGLHLEHIQRTSKCLSVALEELPVLTPFAKGSVGTRHQVVLRGSLESVRSALKQIEDLLRTVCDHLAVDTAVLHETVARLAQDLAHAPAPKRMKYSLREAKEPEAEAAEDPDDYDPLAAPEEDQEAYDPLAPPEEQPAAPAMQPLSLAQQLRQVTGVARQGLALREPADPRRDPRAARTDLIKRGDADMMPQQKRARVNWRKRAREAEEEEIAQMQAERERRAAEEEDEEEDEGPRINAASFTEETLAKMPKTVEDLRLLIKFVDLRLERLKSAPLVEPQDDAFGPRTTALAACARAFGVDTELELGPIPSNIKWSIDARLRRLIECVVAPPIFREAFDGCRSADAAKLPCPPAGELVLTLQKNALAVVGMKLRARVAQLTQSPAWGVGPRTDELMFRELINTVTPIAPFLPL